MTSSSLFFEHLKQHAQSRSEHHAIVTDDLCLSYSALLQLVIACASILQKKSISQDSIVGLSISNEVLNLITSLALLTIGAKQIDIATHDPLSVRVRLADHINVTCIIAIDDAFRLENIDLVLVSSEAISDLAESASEEDITVAQDPFVEQIYLRTSGTTGGMSVVGFSQYQVAQQALRYTHYTNDRVLLPSSIEHNNGRRHRFYTTYMGGTSIFRDLTSLPLAEFCHQHNVTCLDTSRLHAADLVWGSSHRTLDLPVNVKLIVSGTVIPFELRHQIKQHVTANLYVIYGASEFGSSSTATPDDHDISESVGFPMKGVEVEVVDQSGNILPLDTIGEVRLKAEGMATHYVNNPEKTAQQFRKGWFYPGDIGSIKSNGELIIHGRQDDLIILNGLNIAPIEIERILENHPSVKMAAALGIKSAIHGQIPVAAVELHNNATITATELQAYARKELALRAPRKILVVDVLPSNAMGKFLKQEIALMFKK